LVILRYGTISSVTVHLPSDFHVGARVETNDGKHVAAFTAW
jgi:hypothetical protein